MIAVLPGEAKSWGKGAVAGGLGGGYNSGLWPAAELDGGVGWWRNAFPLHLREKELTMGGSCS